MSSVDRLSIPRRQKTFSRKLMPLGDSLPYWSQLSLDSKLPVAPCPKGSFTLYTTQMGQPKYVSRQRYDFDLTDPLGNATPAEYDSLQDPFLRHHFEKPRHKRHLVNNGLITKNDKVICSLKEFNDYREYLRYRSVTDFNLKRRRQFEHQAEHQPFRKANSQFDVSESNSLEHRNSLLRARLEMYGGSDNLVAKLKMREDLLSLRMEEKRIQQLTEINKKIKESWEDRKRRQQEMLELEMMLEHTGLNKRREQLERREKMLAKQREQQLARLDKIKTEYLRTREKKFGKRCRMSSFVSVSQSQRTIDLLPPTNQKNALQEKEKKASAHAQDDKNVSAASNPKEREVPKEKSEISQNKTEGDTKSRGENY